jgi:type II secretory pathway component PulK
VSGVARDLAQRLLERALDDADSDRLVALGLHGRDGAQAAQQRHAAAGTMPSSTAALVACIASSTRAFFSFISVSVAAPTLISATPPTSFASRSCSFSRS